MTGQDMAAGIPGDNRSALVRLVSRLLVTQAGLAAAIGPFFTRRHLPSVFITLLVVAVLCGLALVARTGTHAVWVAILAAEGAYILIGLLRFATASFAGGTLLAIVTAGVLIHPAVAHAFGSGPRRASQAHAQGRAKPDPGEGELGQA